LREHDRLLKEAAASLRTRPESVPEAVRTLASARKELERAAREGGAGASLDLDALLARVSDAEGARLLATTVDVPDAKALLELVDRLKGRIGDAAILLGTAADGRVHLLASVAPALVARGVRAGDVVKAAARVVGGGGGGRDTLAQAGGRDPAMLDEAIRTGEAAIVSALQS
jgi:alanyl-tRNA synthetase